MVWTIGVDVGGTFTDFHAVDPDAGVELAAKRPSTPADPSLAILEGLDDLLGRAPLAGQPVARFAHGTTVATNALIQRRGGRVALVTTRGFRDLLAIGRQKRPHMYDLFMDAPDPLVPPDLRFEVRERVTAGGRVMVPLDEGDVDAVVDRLAASGVEACAVCLLFAHEHPEHERAVGQRIAARLPHLHVSLSSDVQPEFREFERFSTTVVNAALQPVMARYVERLEAGLAERLPGAHVGINQSSGGLMSPARARALPVRTALSGPAAGVVGAAEIARRGGFADVVTLDMGGTSADVALVRGGRHDTAPEREVAGFPIRLPQVDVETVGAGGGSLAWVDRDGLMKVGPESAGADPGPAAYGRGGTRPTVTDANLVLGRLAPRGLLGGGMPLDTTAAGAALRSLADALGLPPVRTARGVVDIAVANMVRSIRTISVERGHDPRDFALMAFGGAGPLHARLVAGELGMRTIVVPPAPGLLCARGLVVADLQENFVASRRTGLDGPGLEAVSADLAGLVELARRWWQDEDVAPEARALGLVLDLRYLGQNFELGVEVATADAGAAPVLPDAEHVRALFEAAHETAYGFHDPEAAVECVNVRLTAFGRLARRPAVEGVPTPRPAPDPRERRAVVFVTDEPVPTPVFERGDLVPGTAFEGPAIVEQLDATTVVFPGDRARIDAAGNLLIGVGDG